MKFYIDTTLVTENGEALGFFNGIREFNDIPMEGEKSQLFDGKSQYLPFELKKYAEQSLILEHVLLDEKPNYENVIGSCLFSFFYIPTIATKDIFVSYFEQHYDLYFWDFSED